MEVSGAAVGAEGVAGEGEVDCDGEVGDEDVDDGDEAGGAGGELCPCAAEACAPRAGEDVDANNSPQHAIATRIAFRARRAWRGFRDTSVSSFNFRSTEPSPLPVISAGAEAAGTRRLEFFSLRQPVKVRRRLAKNGYRAARDQAYAAE